VKCIILAAGYATRLYPLTKNRPKPLLEVAGKTILDHIVEKLERVDQIDEIIIVTNEKFASHFEEWAGTAFYQKTLTVINDGTLSNEERLGAIGDIELVLEELNIEDDLMVLAGDNLFDFELTDFVEFFEKVGSDCITIYYEENSSQLKQVGVADTDDNGKVTYFEEKSEHPKTSYVVPPFYLYKKETLSLFNQYIEEGYDPDAPGHFIPFLKKHKPIYAFFFNGKRYDIGTIENYQRVQELFSEKY